MTAPIVPWETATGQVFRSLRKLAGYQQDELAARLGVSRSTVRRVEHGSRVAPDLAHTWMRLCGCVVVVEADEGDVVTIRVKRC